MVKSFIKHLENMHNEVCKLDMQSPQKATLPIKFDGDILMDSTDAHALGTSLSKTYQSAAPYPHIVIDDFLPVALIEAMLEEFPEGDPGGNTMKNRYGNFLKRQTNPEQASASSQRFFHFMNSAPVLQFLEGLTGIKGLISDPYYEGGGFHEIYSGGHLGIHADFRVHRGLLLARRLNMLIYLNKDWQESYGGALELWDQKMKERCAQIAPLFNRCVIFNTDDKSHHGHPEPLSTPPDVTRKSMALYYYTSTEKIWDDAPVHTTMYQSRPDADLRSKFGYFRRRLGNYIVDWTPPILLRNAKAVKRRLAGLK